MLNKKIFRVGIGILLVLLILYFASLVSWVFSPIKVVIESLFIPLIITAFLFYLLRPIVKFLNKKLSNILSIFIVYILLAIVLTSFILIIGPAIRNQFHNLTNNMPKIISEIQNIFIRTQESDFLQRYELNEHLDIESIVVYLDEILSTMGKYFSSNITNLIGTLANTVFALIIIPFILFYLLRDEEKIKNTFLNFFNNNPNYRDYDIETILKNIDKTISSYIQGLLIVCLSVGIMCYIIFLILGLEYSLLLAIIAGVTNVIPYLGPWIGTVPPVIVAFFQSPLTALIVIILVVIIQQIESHLIAPQVLGKKLNIHPITIIFLVTAAGRLAGLIGMILAVPSYAIGKILLVYGIKIWKIKNKSAADQNNQ